MAGSSDNGGVSTVGIVGSGLIGSGWAARCLASGLDVIAWDPNPAAETGFRTNVDNAWVTLSEIGLAEDASLERLRFVSELEECAKSSDFLQENAPDNETLKRDLITQLDGAAGPEAIIASSSSGILPTLLQRDCANPERVIIGHPFNPVYLLKLVEIMGGEKTSRDTLTRAGRFYRSIGMRPLHARVEVAGYISDRLQQCVFHEALYMIREGVATAAEIDASITAGPGRRWAFLGPMMAFHLAGGEGGLRHAMEHWSPEEVNPWTHLPAPDFTPELIEAAAGGCEKSQGARSIKDFEKKRDKCLLAIDRALEELWFSAGEDGWPEMNL